LEIPGFKGVGIRGNNATQVGTARSGRRIATRAGGGHRWSFSIEYNEIPWDVFAPVSAFLHSREGRLKPFFVSIPPHTRPRDVDFGNFCLTNNLGTVGVTNAGSSKILFSAATSIVGNPMPGDFFNILDPLAMEHTKAYKVVGVENASNYISNAVPANQRRITFKPPLIKAVSSGSLVKFIQPMFKVSMLEDFYEDNIDADLLVTQRISVEETY
jgi:hypothetical protein